VLDTAHNTYLPAVLAIVHLATMVSSISARSVFAFMFVILSLLGAALAADKARYITATVDGEQVQVLDNRRPALYTGKFGDCMGDSSLNVTRFDAAYYKDNMTILFHLGAETALKNESIMSKKTA
jgi:hypothetical protein